MSRAEVAIPIDAITAEVAAYRDEIVNAVANETLRETRNNAARAFTTRGGGLVKSIKKQKSKINEGSVIVKASDPKAHLIEYGHDVKISKDGTVVGHAAAHPFLGPASDAVRDRLPEIINSVVGSPTITVGK